ncbi:serine/threonine protein kinase [Providencia rettgeri]|uniref:serine/threonine-protein kinase n=1 Tax=Providencia rettgeri TaxID=587 RepID=UPI00197F42C4|nr:serine/threonine-protein kinase [Providencia rettgeri]MBN6350378.1 serine/threonine protein kinase [Providencia rettgeri]
MIEASYTNATISFKEIKELEEQGKNSRVFTAHDKNLDCELVIKEIKKDIFDFDKYFNEARKLYNSSHPNVVQIQYAAQDKKNIYLGFPYYRNGSLHNLMKNVPLSVSDVLRFSIQFLSGLYHIHTKKLMHFDIKPNNIMLSDRGEALLSDFGLAETINDDGFASPVKLYNMHRAPETFHDQEYDFTTDIYQAGMTIYRMLIGHSRFDLECDGLFANATPARLIIDGEFPNKKYPHHVPRSLINIVNKCLSTNKEDRYPSVQLLLNDLAKIDASDNLSWRMMVDSETMIWHGIKNNAKVIFSYDTKNKETQCIREIKNNKTQKVSAFCAKNVSDNQVRSMLTM